MKKSQLFPASLALLALLALGSLAPRACSSSPQAHVNDRIEYYNKELGKPFRSLHQLRAAPSLARVIQSIPFSWHDNKLFLPSGDETRDDGGYNAYAKAQYDLLAAVEMTPYVNEQQQEELWERTLAAQAQLKAKYPLAAQKLTDVIALVDETWRRERARPQTEREKNAAEHLKEREELAKESGIYLCYHQYSPAMQELLLRYLTLSLEYEIRLYSQDPTIAFVPKTKLLLAEEIRILQSLDTSKLNEEQRVGIQQAIARKTAFSLDIAQVNDSTSLKQCYKEHAESRFYTIWDETHVLYELLKHLDLRDYYVYVLAQEYAKRTDDESLQYVERTNRRILDAIKKAMAAQKTTP